jgi:energy-coupling factor transporter ATP-binding protein EcfA2
MRFVDRNSVAAPSGLVGEEAAASRRALAEYFSLSRKEMAQTRVPYSFSTLEDKSIHAALRRLFHSKCAFCESAAPIFPHRFRPPSDAIPAERKDTAHLYYVWLADAWNNIYALCGRCRPEEPSFFPIRGTRMPLPTRAQIDRYARDESGRWMSAMHEAPLLLDPGLDKSFVRHLKPSVTGRLDALSVRGSATIAHFNLNRPELIEDRRGRLEEYLGRLAAALHAPGADSDREVRTLLDFEQLEFGGVWYLLLRGVLSALAKFLDLTLQPGPAQIAASVNRLRALGIESDMFRDAVQQHEEIRLEPVRVSVRQRGRARLRSVSIVNYKAIGELKFEMPPERTPDPTTSDLARAETMLILGENASGKSSVLEAIALALADEAAREVLDLDPDDLVLKPSLLAAPEVSQPPLSQIELVFDGSDDVKLVIKRGRTGGIRAQILDSEVEGRAPPPVLAYGAYRHFAAGTKNYRDDRPIVTLFKSDELISNPEKWLISLRPENFEMVARALKVILAVEGDYDVLKINEDGTSCSLVAQLPAPQGETPRRQETPLSVVSSGFRTVLATVCDIFRWLMDSRFNPSFDTLDNAHAVILIDEVEAHLHPRWKMQIMDGLRRALPRATIIATTHDPLCLRGMDVAEVMVLHKVTRPGPASDGKTSVAVERLERLPNLHHLTVEQLLTSDLFRLFTTDTPGIERDLARMADLLAIRAAGGELSEQERGILARFDEEIAAVLPVGATEVQRLIQQAVAQYLKERREAQNKNLLGITEKTRSDILRHLKVV